MLEVIVTLLAYSKSFLYYTLAASLFMGKTIFDLISTVVIRASIISTSVLTALQILLEDFIFFLHDLSEHAGFGLRLIYRSLEYSLNFFTFFFNPIASTFQWYLDTVTGFFTWLSNFYNNITCLLVFLLTNSKKLLILFGSGVWFALTIIPVAIFSSSLLLVYYLGLLLEELIILRNNLWSKVLMTGEFFFDVPLESILGLCFMASIIYVIYKFYENVIDFVMSVTRELKNKIKFNLMLPKKYEKSDKDVYKKPIDDHDTACIVCGVKPKNMLILPCKHLCVCEECMVQLQRYSRNCPICRSQMERTILVYM